MTATGCSTATLAALLNGTRPRVRRSTAQRIMAVRLADALCSGASVPAIGSVRRLRALVAAGHPVHKIVAATGLEQTTVSYLLTGAVTTIRVRTHQRVEVAFERLALVPGHSARSLARAARNQWSPPLAWDDPDDPSELPQHGDQSVRREAIVEDTAELARQGLSREAVTHRLGVSWAVVQQSHTRCGIPVPTFAA
ncbi:hypothetical protein [Kitasatospora viridis]|nr:hypothetical protein [Kitasatospora viridis]